MKKQYSKQNKNPKHGSCMNKMYLQNSIYVFIQKFRSTISRDHLQSKIIYLHFSKIRSLNRSVKSFSCTKYSCAFSDGLHL